MTVGQKIVRAILCFAARSRPSGGGPRRAGSSSERTRPRPLPLCRDADFDGGLGRGHFRHAHQRHGGDGNRVRAPGAGRSLRRKRFLLPFQPSVHGPRRLDSLAVGVRPVSSGRLDGGLGSRGLGDDDRVVRLCAGVRRSVLALPRLGLRSALDRHGQSGGPLPVASRVGGSPSYAVRPARSDVRLDRRRGRFSTRSECWATCCSDSSPQRPF